MIYPKFPKRNDILGVCAPSSGVGRKIDLYDHALEVLLEQGYQIVETPSVRNDAVRSADAKTRAYELMDLFDTDDIGTIFCASGGNFLMEILPLIDWKLLKRNPKWLWGASDPTGLLYPYTTKYDVATIYGKNVGSFDDGTKFKFIKDALDILKGKKVVQTSFSKIDGRPPYTDGPLKLEKKSKWHSNVKQLNVEGRSIGGCLEVIRNLLGTPYDGTKSFIKRYEEDGCIWFFDIYAMSSEDFYLTLLQMKEMGYFENTKAIILGRVIFPSTGTDMSYEEGIKLALPDIPYFTNADIGHTKPHMTMIMGSILNLKYKDNKASLTFKLK